MRILVAHNRYRSATPSGENTVVASEVDLLRDAGIDVVPYIEDSDEIANTSLALGTAVLGPILSPRGVSRFRRLLLKHRPDVVHLHNVYPLISPWVVRIAAANDVPVVQTVHNYRHTCVAGMHLRNDQICEDCRGTTVSWPAALHGCYRGSRSQSALMALGQAAHGSTWRSVDQFLVTNPMMRDLLVSIGIHESRVEWRPPFASDTRQAPLPADGGVAFIGRLDRAKGIELLLEAWTAQVANRWGRLTIAGDGPLAPLVKSRAASEPSIRWEGTVDEAGVRRIMTDSSVVAMPSMWYEGFPRVAAEAMSAGRPLLLWAGMGISNLADAGAAWALPADPEVWTRHLVHLSKADLAQKSNAAREYYDKNCSARSSLKQLMRIYERLADRSVGK